MSLYQNGYEKPEPIKMSEYTETRKRRFVLSTQVDEWNSDSANDRKDWSPARTFTLSQVAELRPGEFFLKKDILEMVTADQIPRGVTITLDMLPDPVQNEDVIPCFKHGLMVGSTGSVKTGYMWVNNYPLVHHYGADHFPIIIRMPGSHNLKHKGKTWYLHNGDRWAGGGGWGSPTSSYQSQAERVFPNQPTLSLGLLRTANINYADIYLVDFWADKVKTLLLKDHEFMGLRNVPWQGRSAVDTLAEIEEFEKSLPKTGMVIKHYTNGDDPEHVGTTWHLIGSVLFRHNDKYYLGAMDEGRYFLSQLPRKCARVQTAFEMMKPNQVRTAIRQGADVKRQGEWFFIPVDALPENIFKKDWIPWYDLPQKDSRGDNKHIAIRGIMQQGNHYVRGNVKHISEITDRHSGEHQIMKFGENIHMAVLNTTLADWSTSGRGID